MEKPIKYKKSNAILDKATEERNEGRAQLVNLESFTKALNRSPAVTKINKFQNNAKYIPISHIQTLLDQLFFGLWQTKNFTYQVVGNELIGRVELWVYHPVIKEWLVRTGVAATQIRQNKGAAITDINSKIKNALEMDAPHLYADCIKSACKTLGPAFGRDLNRDFVDNYKAMVSGYVEKNTYSVEEVAKKLQTIGNLDDWATYWASNPLWQNDPKIQALFENRQQDIQTETFSR
jgi:hypothetical protein